MKNIKKNQRKKSNIINKKFSKCVICQKPLNKKGWYCSGCINKTKRVNEFLIKNYNLKYPLTRKSIAIISNIIGTDENVFDYIENNPRVVFLYFGKTKEEKENVRQEYTQTRKTMSLISLINIPKYIKYYFMDNEDKQLIELSGTEDAPIITSKCLKCSKIFVSDFKALQSSNLHYCESSLSSGEFIIKKYLEDNNIKFLTQRDTLRCINPITGYLLPYDFELEEDKVIIEVQGEQHLHYVSIFHSSEEVFKYQQYKDRIKREFAVSKGYKYLEIFYKDINNMNYKSLIDKIVMK